MKLLGALTETEWHRCVRTTWENYLQLVKQYPWTWPPQGQGCFQENLGCAGEGSKGLLATLESALKSHTRGNWTNYCVPTGRSRFFPRSAEKSHFRVSWFEVKTLRCSLPWCIHAHTRVLTHTTKGLRQVYRDSVVQNWTVQIWVQPVAHRWLADTWNVVSPHWDGF